MTAKLMNADFCPEETDDIDCGFQLARFTCAKYQFGYCPIERFTDLNYFRAMEIDKKAIARWALDEYYCSWCASILLHRKPYRDKPIPMVYERKSNRYRCLEQEHFMCVAQKLNKIHGLGMRVKVDMDIEDC